MPTTTPQKPHQAAATTTVHLVLDQRAQAVETATTTAHPVQVALAQLAQAPKAQEVQRVQVVLLQVPQAELLHHQSHQDSLTKVAQAETAVDVNAKLKTTSAQLVHPVQREPQVKLVHPVSQVWMVWPVKMPKMSHPNVKTAAHASTAQLVNKVHQVPSAVQVHVVTQEPRDNLVFQAVTVTQVPQENKDHLVHQATLVQTVCQETRAVMPNIQLAVQVQREPVVQLAHKVHKETTVKTLAQEPPVHKVHPAHQEVQVPQVTWVQKEKKVSAVVQDVMLNTVHVQTVLKVVNTSPVALALTEEAKMPMVTNNPSLVLATVNKFILLMIVSYKFQEKYDYVL